MILLFLAFCFLSYQAVALVANIYDNDVAFWIILSLLSIGIFYAR